MMLGRDPDWLPQARCANADQGLWYPPKGGSAVEAKAICNGDPNAPVEKFRRPCPVREQCLEWALTVGDHQGIWGGLTARERGALHGVAS